MKGASPSCWNRLNPSGMGGFYCVGIFAAAKMAHLSDDKTVAKMGYPALIFRDDLVDERL